MTDTHTLLSEYVEHGSESAFRELVKNYLDLVYSTALRFVGGDTHLAEDIAQIVFVDLAQKAKRLPQDMFLGGWLHRDTCFVAGKTMRAQRRRQAREREAAEMNALNAPAEADFKPLAPILDEAINQLGTTDRTAILLRFYEHRDFRSIGQALGSNEDTAQKRVSRALDKLHGILQGHGVTLSAAALGSILASQAVTSAPLGLAATISGTALASAATTGGMSFTLLTLMTITKAKLGIMGAIILALVTIPLVSHYQSNPTRTEEPADSAQTTLSNRTSNPTVRAKTGLLTRPGGQQPTSATAKVPEASVLDASGFDPLNDILKGNQLSAEQVQALENQLVREPEDLAARCQLLGYYGKQQFTSPSARETRQKHLLWFIEHHPELRLRGYGTLDAILEGPAYQQAKTLWLQQVNDHPQNLAILDYAADFCLIHDRTTAEALYQQAQAWEPTNATWSERLAHLYALDDRSNPPGAGVSAAAVKALEQMESAQANTIDEQKKFYNLEKLAPLAFNAGQIERAQNYAAALLQQAAQPPYVQGNGDAIHCGNTILGRIALRQKKLAAAKQYLLASAQTTGSPVLGSFGPSMTLAKELLEQGEKEVVLDYFQRCTNFWKNDKLTTWIQQVNQGYIPDFGSSLRN